MNNPRICRTAVPEFRASECPGCSRSASPNKDLDHQPNFESLMKTYKDKYSFYEKLYEMDVAYTIQKDLEEEND